MFLSVLFYLLTAQTQTQQPTNTHDTSPLPTAPTEEDFQKLRTALLARTNTKPLQDQIAERDQIIKKLEETLEKLTALLAARKEQIDAVCKFFLKAENI